MTTTRDRLLIDLLGDSLGHIVVAEVSTGREAYRAREGRRA